MDIVMKRQSIMVKLYAKYDNILNHRVIHDYTIYYHVYLIMFMYVSIIKTRFRHLSKLCSKAVYKCDNCQHC